MYRRGVQEQADSGIVGTSRNHHGVGRRAPAVAMVVFTQPVDHRGLRGRLQHGIDGGGDVVAAIQHVLAVAVDHLLAHHFRDIGRIHLDRTLVRGGVHRRGACGIQFAAGNEAEREHPRQDVIVTTLARANRIGDRVAAGREFRDTGQGGGLVDAELVERLAVVVLGGRCDPVGAVAEEALVQVQREDLLLAELALHLHRQQHFLEFAAEAVFGAEEELLGDLLGDGGATGHTLLPAGFDQQPDGAGDALHIDAVVLVEVGVLGGQKGLPDALWNLIDFNGIATLFAEQADQLAIARVDVHRLLQLDVTQHLHVG